MNGFVFLQAAMGLSFFMIASTILVFILSLIFSWIYYLKKNWNEDFSWKIEILQLTNIFKIAFGITILFIGILLMLVLIWNPIFM